ncbi:MAG TPA: DUF4920 domain-containing protein [Polyangiaceae bacterium]|jgi:hypothetical protein|nr:DUF4920 domain-containing protein [Polyangiaceae bacterium]
MIIGIGKALVLVAAACSAGGCQSGDPRAQAKAVASAAIAAPAPAAPATRFGAPLGKSPVVALADIVRETSKYAKTTVKTEGQVTAVCQAAGCWMEIADGNGEAHIRMSGHSFLVPKSASGRRARVEGTVLPKPDNGECEQEALEATGKTVKVELDATGVELL